MYSLLKLIFYLQFQRANHLWPPALAFQNVNLTSRVSPGTSGYTAPIRQEPKVQDAALLAFHNARVHDYSYNILNGRSVTGRCFYLCARG